MTIERIVHYVLYTPHNTNKAILTAMLEELIRANGNNCGGCDHPDCPNNPNNPKNIVYDGGNEYYSGGDLNQDGIIDIIYDGGMET